MRNLNRNLRRKRIPQLAAPPRQHRDHNPEKEKSLRRDSLLPNRHRVNQSPGLHRGAAPLLPLVREELLRLDWWLLPRRHLRSGCLESRLRTGVDVKANIHVIPGAVPTTTLATAGTTRDHREITTTTAEDTDLDTVLPLSLEVLMMTDVTTRAKCATDTSKDQDIEFQQTSACHPLNHPADTLNSILRPS